MVAKSLLDQGQLTAAVERQVTEVKARPSDLPARTFLFELLCYLGAWDRAGRQIDAIEHLLIDDPASKLGVIARRRLLAAEVARASLFTDGLSPRFALEPTAEVSQHLDALGAIRKGQLSEARASLNRADEGRTLRPGELAGSRFEDFCDADDVLAPVLEVFAPSGYCWIPWEHIQFLEVAPPSQLIDLLWAPAKIAMFDGQLGEVHLPTLYPGPHAHAEETVRLGRRTDWVEIGEGIIRGVGLKTFLVGDEARTLFELSEVRFAPPAEVVA